MAVTKIKRKHIMATTKKPAVAAKAATRAKKVAARPKSPAPTKEEKPARLRVGASAKAAATKRGEPYISVVSVELDPENVGNGAFELDWNEIFVARLVKAGYTGRDDQQIVDRWFQDICRNVLMENFEQWEVNQSKEDRLTLNRRSLGDGRTEVS